MYNNNGRQSGVFTCFMLVIFFLLQFIAIFFGLLIYCIYIYGMVFIQTCFVEMIKNSDYLYFYFIRFVYGNVI